MSKELPIKSKLLYFTVYHFIPVLFNGIYIDQGKLVVLKVERYTHVEVCVNTPDISTSNYHTKPPQHLGRLWMLSMFSNLILNGLFYCLKPILHSIQWFYGIHVSKMETRQSSWVVGLSGGEICARVCVLKLSDVLSSLLKENITPKHPKKLFFTVYLPFSIILTNYTYIEVY